MTPYTIQSVDGRYRIVGPSGFATKPFPADSFDRLKDIIEMLNAAYAEGVKGPEVNISASAST